MVSGILQHSVELRKTIQGKRHHARLEVRHYRKIVPYSTSWSKKLTLVVLLAWCHKRNAPQLKCQREIWCLTCDNTIIVRERGKKKEEKKRKNTGWSASTLFPNHITQGRHHFLSGLRQWADSTTDS